MNVLNKQTYTTTVLDIEIDGEEFHVIHSEDYDDVFVPEYLIISDNDGEVEPGSPLYLQVVEEVNNYMNYTVNALN
jgi:translation elongation factor P/translation initiation factor 5A